MLDIKLKRIYEPASLTDGKRILVDRLWPRGVTKEQAKVDIWMREVAPSPDLRKWFCHKPELFSEFRAQYLQELTQDPVHKELVQQLAQIANEETVTLVFAAKDPVNNHVVVLNDALQGNF